MMAPTEITPIMPIQPPNKATLAKYGFGCGPAALSSDPEMDWMLMLADQGGICPITGKVPSPSKVSGLVRMVIDHEHIRGWAKLPPEARRVYVRGLTSWYANSAYLARGITVAKAQNVVAYLLKYEERRPPR